MPRPTPDLSGCTYGRLTAIRSVKKKGRTHWICSCSCGNTTTVDGTSLKNGHSHSCGCLVTGHPAPNMVGRRFGRLVVQSRARNGDDYDGHVRAMWNCLCDCGVTKVIDARSLRAGATKSCGCFRSEMLRKGHITHGQSCGRRRTVQYALWLSAKRRAKDENVEFTLKLSDVIVPERCPALGIPLIQHSKTLWGNSPTIDRVRANVGYVPSNVCVISHRANSIKQNASARELRLVAGYVERELGK
jgi:hypothetical protein